MIYSVIHDYGRLITHEFPITDLQQISGPDGIGRINCTVSRGRDKFGNDRQFETVGVTQTRKGATITLIVNLMNVASFGNRDVYCDTDGKYYFYLFLYPRVSADSHMKHYMSSTIYVQENEQTDSLSIQTEYY